MPIVLLNVNNHYVSMAYWDSLSPHSNSHFFAHFFNHKWDVPGAEWREKNEKDNHSKNNRNHGPNNPATHSHWNVLSVIQEKEFLPETEHLASLHFHH